MLLTNDIEAFVSTFFEHIGFQRVSNIVGSSPSFKNADFIDTKRDAIVELKVINKDFFKNGGVIDRFHSVVPVPVDVDAEGLGLYSIEFPGKNREGKTDTFEEPLRKILKKANRQIRETKVALKMNKCYGFIFIILDGFESLPISTVNKMVIELLKKEFSSISGHIIYTERPEIRHPGTGTMVPGSLSEITPRCDGIGESICRFIAESWINYINESL